jgi:hypothetical protein
LNEDDEEGSFEPELSPALITLVDSFVLGTVVEPSESTLNELDIKSTCLTLLFSNLFKVELEFETRLSGEEV